MGHTCSSAFPASLLLAAFVALTGCSLSPTSSPTAATAAPGALHGNVHGGQQPVVGAQVYLFAANTTGYGGNGIPASAANASLSLLNPASTGHSDALSRGYVLTGADGGFTITNDYTCTVGQPVYVYAVGGNPGAGTNSAASFLAILGTCPAAGNFATATPFIWLNEVSTVAAAYAFSGFASDATHISSSNTALARTGIANAFASATNLVTLSTGIALTTTPGNNGTAPQTTINGLANILAACVNASDANPGQCPTLFTNALSGVTVPVVPTDTATAAVNIAQHPANALTVLLGLISGIAAPFLPSLPVNPLDPNYPKDFTLAVQYTGGGLDLPVDVAIDAAGSVWIANSGTTFGTGSVTKLSSTGTAISTSAGYTGGGIQGPTGIAIDATGNVWVSNNGIASTVAELSNAGAPISGASGYTDVNLFIPSAIAIDSIARPWVPNFLGDSVTRFANTGTTYTGTTFTGGGIAGPSDIAIDGAGNVWTANSEGSSVSKLSSAGDIISAPAGYTGGGLDLPSTIAIDNAGNAWVGNLGAGGADLGSVTKLSSTGTPASTTGFTGGGLNQPTSIAIDGSGNAWITNILGTVTELSNAGAALSGPLGFLTANAAGLDNSSGIAIDGSGNVWVARTSSSTITELIGAAAPVITPLVTGVTNNIVATRP